MNVFSPNYEYIINASKNRILLKLTEDMKEFKKHTVEQWINNKKGGETVFNRYMDLHLSLTEASDARKKPTDQELDELTSELENKLCCNK